MMMQANIEKFLQAIKDYYELHGRHELPWRLPNNDSSFEPYKILVSEMMLQQTQVSRVIPKYYEFLQRFPDCKSLAASALGDVLIAWQGLGYNRRAKFLWRATQVLVERFDSQLPANQTALMQLPGVGRNTAGALLVYTYNLPALFIETNIRTVYLHHFFKDQSNIADSAIAHLLERTLDRENPRQFYWSIMDYGTYLKQTIGNVGKASAAYTKQSAFQGSQRQLRGRVLRILAQSPQSATSLIYQLRDERAADVLSRLCDEGLVSKTRKGYRLP